MATLRVGLLRSFACWDYGLESRRGYGCLSRESVVCCQVEACATCLSLVQTSPIEGDVSECDSEASTVRRPWPTGGYRAIGMEKTFLWITFRYGFNLYIYIYI